ncbi:MAG TPA: DUF1385 domain-containing protein [Bacillota bacterium]|nr:DUF1385 domain-containing protein [Bacillota bacterium]
MKKQPEFQYGGQAVIEGVMMRGRDYLAVAVRKNDGEIIIKKDPVGSVTKKYPFLKWPFVRGVVSLVESFGIGMKALMFSADQFIEGEGQEKLSGWETAIMITVALAMTVVLFVVLPLLGRMLLKGLFKDVGHFWEEIVESILRLMILVAYIVAVSFLKDIQRVFSYHGAEHKVINMYEAKDDLTVENAKKYTTFHPRCGTSFLLFVVIISAVFFAFLKYDTIWMRLISRISLLPVIAAVSYEILKFVGKHQEFFLWRWLSKPGFWLQKLTTREPDDSMVEVAITSLVAVLQEEAPVVIGGKILTAEKVEVETATTS